MNKQTILVPLSILYLLSVIGYFIYLQKIPKELVLPNIIDGCCCGGDLIRNTNNQIFDSLETLVETRFFRTFRVDLEKECPFWVQNIMCKSKSKCAVCTCDENEIPIEWRKPELRDPVILKSKQEMSGWKENSLFEEWNVEPYEQDEYVYVNLKDNIEAFTGYQGQKIWPMIYNENCFKDNEFKPLCTEEKLFNKLISGMHSSINVHLSELYNLEEKGNSRYNMNLFYERVGNYPERIENLYFAYSFLLRAINIASKYFENFDINTGNLKEDFETITLFQEILQNTTKSCESPFDENEIFNDESRFEIQNQYEKYIHNISRILDCVECQKCRLFGKLQVFGLGTALKIILAAKQKKPFPSIKRNEFIVSFFR